MSILKTKELHCCNCTKNSEFTVCESASSSGSVDLDFRPYGSIRFAFGRIYVKKCPNCGYCSYDIENCYHMYTVATVISTSYKKQLNNEKFPDKANEFLCKSIILEKHQEIEQAAWAALHASWICDDSKKYEQSKVCRMKAIELFELANKNMEISFKKVGKLPVLLVDLYRRAKHFKKANRICLVRLKFENDDLLLKILHFQKHLIELKDFNVHKVENAIEYYDENFVDGVYVDDFENKNSEHHNDIHDSYDDEFYRQSDYERDYFDTMTDGEFGDYDDFIRRGGNIDDIDSWAGR